MSKRKDVLIEALGKLANARISTEADIIYELELIEQAHNRQMQRISNLAHLAMMVARCALSCVRGGEHSQVSRTLCNVDLKYYCKVHPRHLAVKIADQYALESYNIKNELRHVSTLLRSLKKESDGLFIGDGALIEKYARENGGEE